MLSLRTVGQEVIRSLLEVLPIATKEMGRTHILVLEGGDHRGDHKNKRKKELMGFCSLTSHKEGILVPYLL